MSKKYNIYVVRPDKGNWPQEAIKSTGLERIEALKQADALLQMGEGTVIIAEAAQDPHV